MKVILHYTYLLNLRHGAAAVARSTSGLHCCLSNDAYVHTPKVKAVVSVSMPRLFLRLVPRLPLLL